MVDKKALHRGWLVLAGPAGRFATDASGRDFTNEVTSAYVFEGDVDAAQMIGFLKYGGFDAHGVGVDENGELTQLRMDAEAVPKSAAPKWTVTDLTDS